MILSMLVGLTLAQADQGDYREPPSLYRAITVVATGKNGYEDYLKGIDRLRAGDVLGALKTADAEGSGLTYLEARRALVAKYRDALADIRRGNGKPVTNPRWEVEADRTLPELRWIAPAARIFEAEAYVRTAGGDTPGGLQSIFDAITFVTNLQANGPLASFDAGFEPIEGLWAEATNQLSRASLADLNVIERWAGARLASKPVLLASLGIEQIFIDATMKGLANNDFLYRRGLSAEMLNELDRMTAAERFKTQAAVSLALTDYVKRWSHTLSLPEDQWLAPEHEPYGDWADRVVLLLEAKMEEAVSQAQVERTRLRLAILTARVNRFRWEFDRLPAKLVEIAPASMLVDPLNGGSYVLEATGEKTAEVYSKGPKGGEPIFLQPDRKAPAKPNGK